MGQVIMTKLQALRDAFTLWLLPDITSSLSSSFYQLSMKLKTLGTSAVIPAVVLTSAAPPGFPATGNGLWYNTPADFWSKSYLPVGNGYLAGAYKHR